MSKFKFLVIIIFSTNLQSQELKTYNGYFEDSYDVLGSTGHAEYTYYENSEYERIFHGKFDYISKLGDFNETTISGTYDHGLKNGTWTYSEKDDRFKNFIKIKGNYNKGLRNGLWTFVERDRSGTALKETTYSLKYKNDTIIGDVSLKDLKGQFDQEGKYIGEWYLQGDDYEFLVEFDNNVLVKLIYRRISDGKLYATYLPKSKDSTQLDSLDKAHEFAPRKTYGISEDSQIGFYQAEAINSFFKDVWKRLNRLQLDNFKRKLFDSYTFRNHPEFLQIIEPKQPGANDILKSNKNVGVSIGSYYNEGVGLDGDGNYLLGGRKVLNKEKFSQECNEFGVVVVSIEVDRSGKVVSATPGVRGTTNNSTCLLEPARRAALATRFNSDASAPSRQIGKIKYTFKLSE